MTRISTIGVVAQLTMRTSFAAALFLFFAPASAMAQDDVVRVDTMLVTVPVSVMDRSGRFIANLKREQFRLYEDGVEQQISFFENAEQPFTIALLLDTSDSTKLKLPQIQDAAIAFVEQLRPDDRTLVVAFDRTVQVLAEGTSDRTVLRAAIRRTQTGGGTSLYNALNMIVEQRLRPIRGRKAIVVFSDGVDTTSAGATYESTLRRAEELDALVYTVQYNTYDDAGKSLSHGQIVPREASYARAQSFLRLLADKSGGRYFNAGLSDLKDVFASIAQELRQQYSVGYYPKAKEINGDKRLIKVSVSVPKVVVRARRSYVYRHSNINSQTP